MKSLLPRALLTPMTLLIAWNMLIGVADNAQNRARAHTCLSPTGKSGLGPRPVSASASAPKNVIDEDRQRHSKQELQLIAEALARLPSSCDSDSWRASGRSLRTHSRLQLLSPRASPLPRVGTERFLGLRGPGPATPLSEATASSLGRHPSS